MVIDNYLQIKADICQVLERIEQPDREVKLVAVSKKQPINSIQELIDYQDRVGDDLILGENFVKEFTEKREVLVGNYISHFIGVLQSNKVSKAVQIFDLIETVGSIDLARLINKEAEKLGRVMPVYLQVNISLDQAKYGFQPDQLTLKLWDDLQKLKCLAVEGLMTITRWYSEAELARDDFKAMRQLKEQFQQEIGVEYLELSMGMSNDYQIAVEEGATVVRVGTTIFGERASGQ